MSEDAAAQIATNTQALEELVEVLQQQGVITNKVTVQSGLFEKGMGKLWTAINKNPVVKMTKQVKGFSSSMMAMGKRMTNYKTMSDEERKVNDAKTTQFGKMIAGMMAMGGTQKALNRYLGNTNSLVTKNIVAFMGLFGIFLLIGVALATLSIAFQGAESPIVGMVEGVWFLEEAVNGLLMVFGHGGEGGLVGIVNVAAAALTLFGVVALTVGMSAGILVGAIVLAAGVAQLLYDATDNVVVAILGGLAVLAVGIAAFAAYVGATATILSAAVLLPVAVVVAGFAAVWAAINGKAPIWVGVIGAIAIAIALAMLAPIIGIPAVIAAVVVMVGAIAWKFKDEIIAFILWTGNWLKNNWKRALVFMAAVGVAIALWPITLTLGIIAVLWKFRDTVVDILLWFPRLVWNTALSIIDKVGAFFGLGEDAGQRFKAWLGDLWDDLMGILGIDSLAGKFSGIIGTIVGVLETPINFIKGFVNDWIIAPINDILDWNPPVIGGGSIGNILGVGNISYMARGGVVTGPTTARLGEQGPEAVIPLSKTGFGGGGFGGPININIDVSGVTDRTDKRRLAREISDILAQEMRRQGGATTRGHF